MEERLSEESGRVVRSAYVNDALAKLEEIEQLLEEATQRCRAELNEVRTMILRLDLAPREE